MSDALSIRRELLAWADEGGLSPHREELLRLAADLARMVHEDMSRERKSGNGKDSPIPG